MNTQLLFFLSGLPDWFATSTTVLLALCLITLIICAVLLYLNYGNTKVLREIEVSKAREESLKKTILIGPKTVKKLSKKKTK